MSLWKAPAGSDHVGKGPRVDEDLDAWTARLAELAQEAYEILADAGIPPLQASKLASMIELIARLVVVDELSRRPK